jgi:transcriptional regulator with XRE-family HTH domain/Zn-dependent peptidase ImmA (M78 family)
MISENNLIKLVLGFKVKYLRHKQGLSYQQLSEKTGLSTSYLHDIEKGKKYPKVDKINQLAQALEVSYDFMVSPRASRKLQPVIDFLTSDFIKEFPLEMFGISPEKLFELFANTPDKVTAFINTVIKITRNYQMRGEQLYQAALRSYQNMYHNYFGELEKKVKEFRVEFGMSAEFPVPSTQLETLLKTGFGITTDWERMAKVEALQKKRSYFSPAKKTLFINRGLTSAQQNFLIGRELGFQYLKLQERPLLTRISEISSFEKLLNNFKASYFSVALLMEENLLAEDIRQLAQQTSWHPQLLLNLIDRYNVTPEMLMQRMTNILPHHLDIQDLFFIRFREGADPQHFDMTKELHLAQPHDPYANKLNEHYCRRWVSVDILKKWNAIPTEQQTSLSIAEAQVSAYHHTPNKYLCLSIAKQDHATNSRPASVTVGMLLNEQVHQTFRFLSDPDLPTKIVGTTCERCSLPDCKERAAEPVIIQKEHQLELEKEGIQRLESEKD